MTNHPNRNWRKRWPEEASAYVRRMRQRLKVVTKNNGGEVIGKINYEWVS